MYFRIIPAKVLSPPIYFWLWSTRTNYCQHVNSGKFLKLPPMVTKWNFYHVKHSLQSRAIIINNLRCLDESERVYWTTWKMKLVIFSSLLPADFNMLVIHFRSYLLIMPLFRWLKFQLKNYWFASVLMFTVRQMFFQSKII